MMNGEQVAVLETAPFSANFSNVLIENQSPRPTDSSLWVWKVFIVFGVLALSLVSFPKQESLSAALTGDNLLLLLNQARLQNGLSPLETNFQLEEAARAKAIDMLQSGYFAHTSPDGAKPWDFIKEAGFTYAYAGENLALNYLNPYELEKDFLQSPSHRDNVLSPNYSETGIAVVTGTLNGQPAVVTVQMFATPASGHAVASK